MGLLLALTDTLTRYGGIPVLCIIQRLTAHYLYIVGKSRQETTAHANEPQGQEVD